VHGAWILKLCAIAASATAASLVGVWLVFRYFAAEESSRFSFWPTWALIAAGIALLTLAGFYLSDLSDDPSLPRPPGF
jgi:hypothetical protein